MGAPEEPTILGRGINSLRNAVLKSRKHCFGGKYCTQGQSCTLLKVTLLTYTLTLYSTVFI